jgi:hypothetical protein
MENRRNFIKNSLGVAAVTTIPAVWHTKGDESPKQKVDWLRNDEKARRLEFFEPARGAVTNPGMGISAYVHSDHMEPNQRSNELLTLDKPTFDRFAGLPYNDNFYLRYEWRDVQKQKGKLSLPDDWKWTMEAVQKYGKRWSFRIMNFMPQSTSRNGLPEFLQGKFKMNPYWHKEITYGKEPYYYPEYSDEYLDYWDELNYLLGEQFDDDPLLDFVDVSGYGLWGEAHHYMAIDAKSPHGAYPLQSPERTEYIVKRILDGHLKAYPQTPGALNVHYAEFKYGLKAFQEGKFWSRRDSFMTSFKTIEAEIAQGLHPGCGMVWEPMSLGSDNKASFLNDEDFDAGKESFLPGRYFDLEAHYVNIGFSPWTNMWAHENCSKNLNYITENIGYRIRPAIIWRRKIKNKNELVLGLRNDGSSQVPGTLSITAKYSNNAEELIELPLGQPMPGRMHMVPISIPDSVNAISENARVTLSVKIKMRGKTGDVQWAVKKKNEQQDNFNLVVELGK